MKGKERSMKSQAVKLNSEGVMPDFTLGACIASKVFLFMGLFDLLLVGE